MLDFARVRKDLSKSLVGVGVKEIEAPHAKLELSSESDQLVTTFFRLWWIPFGMYWSGLGAFIYVI